MWYGPPLEGWERQPRPNLASSSLRGDQRWLLRICRWERDLGCMTATSSRSPQGWFEIWRWLPHSLQILEQILAKIYMSSSMNPSFSSMNKYFVMWPSRDAIVRKEKRHLYFGSSSPKYCHYPRYHRKGKILTASFQIFSFASVLLRIYVEC